METIFQAQKISELKRLGWWEADCRFLSQRRGQSKRYLYSLTNKSGMLAFIYPEQVEYDCTSVKPSCTLTNAVA